MDIFTLFFLMAIGSLVLRWLLRDTATKNTLDEQRLREEVDRRVRMVHLEQVKDQGLMLAYDKENNEFLGQGRTIDEVKQMIMTRWPHKIFYLDNDMFTAMDLGEEQK